jgi:hypothetical protein
MDRISFCTFANDTLDTLIGISYNIVSADSNSEFMPFKKSIGDTTNCTEYVIDIAGGEYIESMELQNTSTEVFAISAVTNKN